MDQVDSLNEIMSSALQSTPMTELGGVNVNNAAVNTANNSPVIAAASHLQSFHYFVSEQAKSMLALQELQNEVGALLEFRDLVMEMFPQLGQRVQTLQSSSQSPSKWEPGIRVKRKLGQHVRDADMLVPSLLPRYRSNSQGGKGSSSSSRSEISGSTASNSAIQDSGFCTESSKDHLSAISGCSKSRETDDELFSLLDSIHNKGTRLKLEVEYLWGRVNRGGGRECARSPASTGAKRRCKSFDDLIASGRDAAAQNYTFEYAVRTAFLESELNALKRERDLLIKKMNEMEGAHLAALASAARLEEELDKTTADKRYLEDRLQDAINGGETIANGGDRRKTANNFLADNQQWTNVQTPVAKCQLLKLMRVFKDTTTTTRGGGAEDGAAAERSPPAAVVEAIPSRDSNYFRARSRSQETRNESSASSLAERTKVERPTNPVMKELNADSYQSTRCDTSKMTSVDGSCGTLASTKDFCDTIDDKRRPLDAARNMGGGKSDTLIGFSSGHASSLEQMKTAGGVTLSREKVLSILNENNAKELRCYLLTLSYQVEALNVHVQQISTSRMNIFRQLNRCKFENEDLKLELKKKEIELEGTKAQKRMLEQKRDVRFSYSTSDLVTSTPKMAATSDAAKRTAGDEAAVSCAVSDSALMADSLLSSSSTTICRNTSQNRQCDITAAKCGAKQGRRPVVSKIPLKTYSSKLPAKAAATTANGKKTLSSFRECLSVTSGPSQSSCISSTLSSLNK